MPQRVLKCLLDARSAPPVTEHSWKRRAIVAGGVVALAAAVVLFVRDRPAPPAVTTVPTAPAPASESRMALADGSTAILTKDAAVVIEEQTTKLVRIRQQKGAVRYEIQPDHHREFAVLAGGAVVRVRGTIFAVKLDAETIEIVVERGRVEVEEGARVRELAAGESLRVPLKPAESAERDPPPERVPPHTNALPTATELQAKADAARASQDLPEAAAALESLVATYPRDARVPSALFSLGRVERGRFREAAAARAFERCRRVAPRGPLAEDALAEAAASWSAAGSMDTARNQAKAYLDAYPGGAHVQRMRALLNP